jgi:hypothetical protein
VEVLAVIVIAIKEVVVVVEVAVVIALVVQETLQIHHQVKEIMVQ